MGEAKRLREQGIQFKQPQANQQITVDINNATPKLCDCGCLFFIPVVRMFKVSALLSPTGKELMVQQPVLICIDCKAILK